MQFQYEHKGTSHSIDLTQLDESRFKATIGDRDYTFSAMQQTDGAWLLSIGKQRVLAYVASDGDMRYVYADGNPFTLSVVDDRRKRRGGGGSAGDLTAQMPGQVVEVSVSEGDEVTAGQTLVILEAMKMEIRVTAPTDGTVHGVFVNQGDVVERGQRLVEVNAHSLQG